MEDLHASLKDIQLALQGLLKKMNSLKKENEQLKKENEEMSKLISENEEQLSLTRQKIITNNISSSYNGEEKQILQSKIDGYLKDIEKCLSLLNA